MGTTAENSQLNPLNFLGKMYFGRGLAAVKQADDGNTVGAVASFAQQLNKIPDVKNDVMDSATAIMATGKGLHETVNGYDLLVDPSKTMDILKDSKIQNMLYNSQMGQHGSKITEFGFFKDTIMEEKIRGSKYEAILKIDKNLLETKAGEKIVKIIDNNAKIETTILENGRAAKFIQANKGATFAAKSLGRIPLLNIAFSLFVESFSLYKAAKNGDFMTQLGRSGINIVGMTAASAALGALMSPLIPPIGSLAGAALGSYIGSELSKKAGDKLFGKSIEEQNKIAQNPVKEENKPVFIHQEKVLA